LAAIFLFSVHIVCFFSPRDLLLSAVAASQQYLPQMSAFNGYMHRNAYCRNFEPMLPCYCYAKKAIFKTILPYVSQPAPASNVADLVNCKLISITAWCSNSESGLCAVWVSYWKVKLSLKDLSLLSCWLQVF